MRTLFETLRRADMTTLGLDACLLHRTLLRSWQEAYTEEHLKTPAWLEEQIRGLTRRIRDLKADQYAARLAQINGALAYLQTPEEQRAALQEERAILQEELTRLEASIAP